MLVSASGIPVRILSPFVLQEMSPVMTVATPSVVMSEFTPSFGYQDPVESFPRRRQADPDESRRSQSGTEKCDSADAVAIDVRPRTDPMDRSKCPAMSGKMAAMPTNRQHRLVPDDVAEVEDAGERLG